MMDAEKELLEAQAQFDTDGIYESALDIVCKRLQWSRDNPSAYVKGWAYELASFARMHIKVAAPLDAEKLREAVAKVPHNVRLHRGNVNAYGVEVLQDLCFEDCVRCELEAALAAQAAPQGVEEFPKCVQCLQDNVVTVRVLTGFSGEFEYLCGDCVSKTLAAPAPQEELRAASEMGWLVELDRGNGPEWLCYDGLGAWDWTKDSIEATRFSRRRDADGVAAIFDGLDVRITEHEWPPPAPSDIPESKRGEPPAWAVEALVNPNASMAEVAEALDVVNAAESTGEPHMPTLTFDGRSYDCAKCGNKQIVLCEHWQRLFERAHAAIMLGRVAEQAPERKEEE